MNEFQQTFVLSMASNQAPNFNAENPGVIDPNSQLSPIEQATQAMQNELKANMPTILSKLGLTTNPTMVWGPAVYIDPTDFSLNKTSPPTYNATASNTMVVFETDPGKYTIAIAGTKATSVFDQVTEDGGVLSIVGWPYGSPSNLSPKISNGTSIGVAKLLTQLIDPVQKNNIAGFLQTINNAGNTITVTGHSLGGALAPALALALFGSSSNLGLKLVQKARVYATAGPDIGNKDYCTYFSQCFAPTGSGSNPIWQQYNQKIWNSYDVVPQSWANLGVIKSIYSNPPSPLVGIPTPDYVNCIINRAQTGLYLNHYAAMDPNKAGQFQGKFVTPSGTSGYDCNTTACTANKLPDGLCDFVAEMLYQHITAYFIEFGLTPLSIPASPCNAAAELYAENICKCAHL